MGGHGQRYGGLGGEERRESGEMREKIKNKIIIIIIIIINKTLYKIIKTKN